MTAMPSSTTSSIPQVRELRPAARLRSTGWVLRRTLLCIVLMSAVASTAAVLVSAGIDPALEQASE